MKGPGVFSVWSSPLLTPLPFRVHLGLIAASITDVSVCLCVCVIFV